MIVGAGKKNEKGKFDSSKILAFCASEIFTFAVEVAPGATAVHI